MTGTVWLMITRTSPAGGGGAGGGRRGGRPGGAEGGGGAPGVGGVAGGEWGEGGGVGGAGVQSVTLSSQGVEGGKGIEGGAGGEEGGDVGGEEILPMTAGSGTSEAAVTVSSTGKETLSWTPATGRMTIGCAGHRERARAACSQKPTPLLQSHVSPSSSHARQQSIAPVSRSTSRPSVSIYVPESGRAMLNLSTTLTCSTVQMRGTRLRDSTAGLMTSLMTYREPMNEPKVRIAEISAAILYKSSLRSSTLRSPPILTLGFLARSSSRFRCARGCILISVVPGCFLRRQRELGRTGSKLSLSS